jgi:hypothetical protein
MKITRKKIIKFIEKHPETVIIPAGVATIVEGENLVIPLGIQGAVAVGISGAIASLYGLGSSLNKTIKELARIENRKKEKMMKKVI